MKAENQEPKIGSLLSITTLLRCSVIFGHLNVMGNVRISKRLLEWNTVCSRRKGRPGNDEWKSDQKRPHKFLGVMFPTSDKY